MSSVHDDGDVGFEEGMLWLPSHVLDEACDPKVHVNVRNRHQKPQQQCHRRLPPESQSQYSKSTSRSSFQRPKHATGGPGMQAIFLGSGQGSCGTGVFLPQRAGTKPTKKPAAQKSQATGAYLGGTPFCSGSASYLGTACAPVLLPARVIQALNLKVHALGLQISPPQVPKYNPGQGEVDTNDSTKKKNDQKDALDQNSSPEIFLPKEWTY